MATHPAALDPKALANQCESRFTRRSGPGGQNRNKVETAVILLHTPTGIGAEASEQRSQGENHKVALYRLRVNLALRVRTERGPESDPSPLWQSRCRNGRLSLNARHDDFPAMLAEALDVLSAESFDPKTAAARLTCSASQLIKLLKEEPRALRLINAAREKQGRHPIV